MTQTMFLSAASCPKPPTHLNPMASTGQDALLVVNDTDANSFSVWRYVENGTTPEIQTNEMTLVGVFSSDAAVKTGNLDLTT